MEKGQENGQIFQDENICRHVFLVQYPSRACYRTLAFHAQYIQRYISENWQLLAPHLWPRICFKIQDYGCFFLGCLACSRGYRWTQDNQLTQLPMDKMAAISADDIFKCIFLNENDRILIQISLKLFRKSPIDNKPALVQVMAWRRIGDKPLPEPMMTQFNDAYRRR